MGPRKKPAAALVAPDRPEAEAERRSKASRASPSLLDLDLPVRQAANAANSLADHLLAAPWRLEVLDSTDAGRGGIYERERLAALGQPSYRCASGCRISWNGEVWDFLDAAGVSTAILRNAALPHLAMKSWESTGANSQELRGLLCKVAPAKRIRVADGTYLLQRARKNLRPVYHLEHHEEEKCVLGENDTNATDEEDSRSHVLKLEFHGSVDAGRWELRRGDWLVRLLGDGATFQPQELVNSGVEVLDSRARDPRRSTHDTVPRCVQDVVEDFTSGQDDQVADSGRDNIQEARAITSVVRWWHLTRYNWVVQVRENSWSQLRDVSDQIVELDATTFSDSHCDFCGRQRNLFGVRAYRKLEACPTQCGLCSEIGLLAAPQTTGRRELIAEMFWSCHKCVHYLLGAPAARLRRKPEPKDTGPKPSGSSLKAEVHASTADSKDVRKLFDSRPLEGLPTNDLEKLCLAYGLRTSLSSALSESRRRSELVEILRRYRGDIGASSSTCPGVTTARSAQPTPRRAQVNRENAWSEDEDDDEDEDEADDLTAPHCACGAPSIRRTVKQGANEGREFFRCLLWPDPEHCGFFQWAPEEGAPTCCCGELAVKLAVRKEGPNLGRQFYSCPKGQAHRCRFFAWADEPIKSPTEAVSAPEEGAPGCGCGERAVKLTVRKEGPHVGRQFYSCPKGQAQQCGFFAWADETMTAPTASVSAGPPCRCHSSAVKRQVQKDGPNKGRSFYACSKRMNDATRCNFFEWVVEDGGAAVKSQSPSPAAANAKASELGGIAGPDRLPTPPSAATSSVGSPLATPHQNASAASPRCVCGLPGMSYRVQREGPNHGKVFFKCGKPQGEPTRCSFFSWAPEAPSIASPPQGAASPALVPFRLATPQPVPPADGVKRDACFRCGQRGHWARSCPQSGD